MSTNKMLKISAIAVIASAGMSMTACANGHTNSRYGNVHDYESGQNCQQPCAPAHASHATSSRYGSTVTTAPAPYVQQAPVYAQPTTVYTQPAPVQSYQAQSYQTQTYSAPVNCPAGTTAQSDGTCMQTSGFNDAVTLPQTFAYGSTSTYSAPTTTYAEPVSCPAGTTAQPDGTCMQGSSYSSTTSSTTSYGSSYDSGSSYTSSYSSVSSEPVNCPAGTTAQPDGTCMQGGSSSYASSSVEIYTGDATASSSATPSYGYTSDGAYGATDYLPIRK